MHKILLLILLLSSRVGWVVFNLRGLENIIRLIFKCIRATVSAVPLHFELQC